MIGTQSFSKFRQRGNCDEKIEALTNIDKFPNATVKDIRLNVPSGQSALSHQQWLDPHREWNQEDFNRQVTEVLNKNFGDDDKSKKPATLDFSVVLPSSTEKTGLVHAKDTQYFSNLMNKMMDFASSKYALVNVNFKSDNFNELYKVHRDEFNICQKDIDDLKRKIAALLGSGKDREGEISELRRKISLLETALVTLEQENRENQERVNKEIDLIDGEIREQSRVKQGLEKQTLDR